MSRTVRRERNEYGLFTFFDNLKLLLSSVASLGDSNRHNRLAMENIDQAIDRLNVAADTLQLLIADIEHLQNLDGVGASLNIIFGNVRSISALLREHRQNVSKDMRETAYTCPTSTPTHFPGRPRYVIEKEQILFLREMHFPWVKIAELIGVSESTLRRRRILYDIGEDHGTAGWTSISDEDLETTVREIQDLTPNIGQARLIGALRSRGLKIPRWRVRECIQKLDPVGTALRWRSPIYRRKYSVPSPNALWHIDSNHKLIRWRLIVHLCIDGYSRLMIYAHCSNDNKAETVLEQFIVGVNTFGLPSRVRCDYGMENFKVAEFMMEHRGVGRGSIITGSSVHNSRVERAHRDVYSGVLCFFARTFTHLEENGLLDPLNELHLFALHYTYIPRINKSLMEFRNQWLNHPLSTERNMTPLQLFTSGILENESSGYAGVEGVLHPDNVQDYGFDPSGPFTLEDKDYQVIVPETTIHLPDAVAAVLESQCNPLQDDKLNGESVYIQCVNLISSMV